MNLEPDRRAAHDRLERSATSCATEIVPREPELDPDADELPRERPRRVSSRRSRTWASTRRTFPEELGGPGIDTVTFTLMAMEMSQHAPGSTPRATACSAGPGLVAAASRRPRTSGERYLFPMLEGEKRGFFALTEPAGGSDPAGAIQTTAHRDGDDWVLNGTKHFISGADRADFGITFARTEQGARAATASPASSSTPTPRAFTSVV